uniref:Uncharacterized protein n=1 Tax=Timema tahoe TaxID=61484 RepID=A0A7R9IF17_9NEOP|nr:unnamed protein product [Timema tahoe]
MRCELGSTSVGRNLLVNYANDFRETACGNAFVPRMRKAPTSKKQYWKVESYLYQLGTSSRVLQRLYARKEFQLADHQFMEMNVPQKELTLRLVAAVDSQSKQGFLVVSRATEWALQVSSAQAPTAVHLFLAKQLADGNPEGGDGLALSDLSVIMKNLQDESWPQTGRQGVISVGAPVHSHQQPDVMSREV